uniref:Uncharacterized protein n=1 Tax=Xenopus tropicalis TaxID=8364 RepID=A0A803J689_XENTR
TVAFHFSLKKRLGRMLLFLMKNKAVSLISQRTIFLRGHTHEWSNCIRSDSLKGKSILFCITLGVMEMREEEISELQKALSDMQVYLFQEREHEDKKKIQKLLALVGPSEGDVTYFHKEPPNKVSAPVETVQNVQKLSGNTSSALTKTAVVIFSSDQMEALQAQLEEQTRLSKEQIETLLEDRKVRMEETQRQHQRDQDKMKSMTDKLNKTQKLLYESTRDFLQLKFEFRANEKSWMAEKDREHEREILRHCHWPRKQVCLLVLMPLLIQSLTEQLAQAHRLAEMYREQCVTLEDELGKIRDEGDVGREIFKVST